MLGDIVKRNFAIIVWRTCSILVCSVGGGSLSLGKSYQFGMDDLPRIVFHEHLGEYLGEVFVEHVKSRRGKLS